MINKNISEMTTRELKKFIRQQVKKANTRLKDITYRKNLTKKGISRAMQEEIDYLKRLGILNKRGKAVTGYRLARKSELQRRARELEYFNQWRGSESKHIARTEDMKKYEKFIKNHPRFAGYSYQDWKNMVENLGAMSEELESYGYVSENMIQLDKEIKERGSKKQLIDVVDTVKSKAKGQGFTQEQLVDAIRQELYG